MHIFTLITKFFINLCMQCKMFVDEGIENKLVGPDVIQTFFSVLVLWGNLRNGFNRSVLNRA